jgi:hypothetical protein
MAEESSSHPGVIPGSRRPGAFLLVAALAALVLFAPPILAAEQDARQPWVPAMFQPLTRNMLRRGAGAGAAGPALLPWVPVPALPGITGHRPGEPPRGLHQREAPARIDDLLRGGDGSGGATFILLSPGPSRCLLLAADNQVLRA